MKKFILTFIFFLFTATAIFADVPPPPPPSGGGGTTGTGGDPLGGGAPVGSGVAILIALGAGYGVFKWKSNSECKNH